MTEEYKTSATHLRDLPAWALALKEVPPSDTIKGGADIVAETPKSDASVITTPVRSGSADNITTPSRAGTVDTVSTPGSDDTADSFPSILTQAFAPQPPSDDIDILYESAKTTGMKTNKRATGKKTNTKAGAKTTMKTTSAKITHTKAVTPGPGLFESLQLPVKPILSDDLDGTERRHATISFYFDNQPKSTTAPGTVALPEISPATPTARASAGNGFSAFTPNTTKFFDDCEAISTEILALPSLTSMFQASYKPTKCERRAAVPSTSGAGLSIAVTPVPGSSKQRISAPSSVATARAASGSRKRTVVDLISSEEDEVEIVAATSTRKGKGKVPAGPKKHKGT